MCIQRERERERERETERDRERHYIDLFILRHYFLIAAPTQLTRQSASRNGGSDSDKNSHGKSTLPVFLSEETGILASLALEAPDTRG